MQPAVRAVGAPADEAQGILRRLALAESHNDLVATTPLCVAYSSTELLYNSTLLLLIKYDYRG